MTAEITCLPEAAVVQEALRCRAFGAFRAPRSGKGEGFAMPKIKTRKSAAKRFWVLKSGKIRRERAAGSHLLEHKQPQQRRRNRKTVIVHRSDAGRIRRQLPNG
jgi:large subunit ribosomal protein L35